MNLLKKNQQPVLAKAVLTVSCAVFGLSQQKGLMVCLSQRVKDPQIGKWVLPGGYVRCSLNSGKAETLTEAAKRELKRDVGLENVSLHQFFTFGDDLFRDPNIRLVTVGYYGLINARVYNLLSEVKNKKASWFSVADLPELAFDHKEIISLALKEMKKDFSFRPMVSNLLPSKFTLSDVQLVFEKVFNCSFDKSNFRKKIIEANILEELDEKEVDVGYRPARLFKFSPRLGPLAETFGLLGFTGSLFSRKGKFSKKEGVV